MADSTGLSAAKVLLLAVQFATTSNIAAFQKLVSLHSRTLRLDIVLRIILTFLPETIDSAEYVPFLIDLVNGQIPKASATDIDTSFVETIDKEDATKRARKLHLLPLAWPNAPLNAPNDPLTLFLIHRAYRIDLQTGLLIQLPDLIVPFLDSSTYLRTWMISTLLPLLRFNYEYYPQNNTVQTIEEFEDLSDRAGLSLLLSGASKMEENSNSQGTVGRDLKGLIGPWLYGDTRWKRRKTRKSSAYEGQTIAPLDDQEASTYHKCAAWEEVFQWITAQSRTSWRVAVEAIDQWDGPTDVDLGGYDNGTHWLDEEEQQQLERQYARSALAAAYLVPDGSTEALTGVHQILSRIITLMDKERVPTLQASAALLPAMPASLDGGIMSVENATYLRNDFLEEKNVLTTPNETSIGLLHALNTSAFLLSRARYGCTVRRAGELALLQNERDQMAEFQKYLHVISNGPKGDDKYWIRTRNELLWLRSWGAEELLPDGVVSSEQDGRGIFGKVKKDILEVEILKALLSNTRYALAKSIYETSPEKPIPEKLLCDTVVAAAMNAFDNATNGNRTRGGVKKCDDIMHTFPETVQKILGSGGVEALMQASHELSNYRLTFKQDEGFRPVQLRIQPDPISLIGKVLDQNARVYTKITELLNLGDRIVDAGLAVYDSEGQSSLTPEQIPEKKEIARKRITSMCVDAALAQDDFETAYSYIMNRLSAVASPALEKVKDDAPHDGSKHSGLCAHRAPKVVDDWSWRAALQAGKYRRNEHTVKPTHIGNANGNLEIRHLQQRMDCLSQALRVAPPVTLQEILNVYRRCEEELITQDKLEAEQENAWDEQGDEQAMPGGFAATPAKAKTFSASKRSEEAPLSLFELARASTARAQSSLASLSAVRGGAPSANKGSATFPRLEDEGKGSMDSRRSSGEFGERERVRKRDQLRNAAADTLASGVGWLIGAQPVAKGRGEE